MNEKDARLRGGLKTPEKVANKIHRGKAANKLKKSSPEQNKTKFDDDFA